MPAVRHDIARAGVPAWSQLRDRGQNTDGRTSNSMVLDSRRNRFVTLGGIVSYYFHGPVVYYPSGIWALALSDSGNWSAVASSVAFPGAAEMAVAYDSVTDQVVCFGGVRQPNPFVAATFPRQLFALNPGSSFAVTVAPVDSTPIGLRGASLVLDPPRRRMLLFGGTDSLGLAHSEVWSMSPDDPTFSWSHLPVTGTPGGRRGHLAVYDPGSDAMIVAGGVHADGSPATDAWSLSLSGPPQWTPMATSGSFPGGRTIGALDAATGRLIVITGTDSALVSALDLGTHAWSELAAGGRTPDLYYPLATALDPVTRRMPLVVEDLVFSPYSGSAQSTTHVLNLAGLPALNLAATFDGVTFLTGITRIYWTVTTDRLLYQPMIPYERPSSGAPHFGLPIPGDGYPDVNGQFESYAYDLLPGRRYSAGIEWFDGTSNRDTPEVDVETPPAARTLFFVQDSLLARGGRVIGWFTASSDSSRMLSTVNVIRRDTANVTALVQSSWPGSDLLYGFVDTGVRPYEQFFYHFEWSDPDTTIRSPEFSIRTPPLPTLWAHSEGPDSILLVFNMPFGYPLHGTVYASYNNNSGLQPLAAIQSDANGFARFVDRGLQPATDYDYVLGWDEGGEERRTGVFFFQTPVGPPPPTPGPLSFALHAPAPNPASVDAAIRLDLPSSVLATLQLIDVGGKRVWSTHVRGPGSIVVPLDVTDLPSGIYFLKLSQGARQTSRRLAIVR